MTIEEATKLLDSAPAGSEPCRINPGITQAQAVEIVRKAIGAQIMRGDSIILSELLEKRVYQVARNQCCPRY